jgi:hypothetical protein
MAPIAIFEAIGPEAEALANAASASTEIPVGFDPEFESFTFDADGVAEDELQAVVCEALAAIDAEWHRHLRPVD